MTAQDLIGKITYQQNGNEIEGRKVTRIIRDDGKWLAWATLPDASYGVHIGPTDSEAALCRLVVSKTNKPKLSQVTPRFAGYAKSTYSAAEIAAAAKCV